jgi:acylphosphatase
MLLANWAIDLDLPGFSAQNRIEDGRQVLIAFFEGDESQVGEFRRLIESEKPPEVEVSSIAIQDYHGQVGDTLQFHQKMSSQHLGKGIDAILRMEKKQDIMLEKQDATIGVLKEVKEDTSSIRNDISELKKDTMDTILEKYFELSREIAEIKATLSEIKAKVS